MRFFPVILAACLSGMALASEAITRGGLSVRVWQSQDGLPGNVVRSVVQSNDGFLWVATAEGIARFDGYEFQLIEPEAELRRFRLAFSRLFTTRGAVWAATYQGGLFQVKNDGLVGILPNLRMPNPPRVVQVIETADGTVLFKRDTQIGIIRNGEAQIPVPDSDQYNADFDADLKRQIAGGRIMGGITRPELTDDSGRRWAPEESGGLTLHEEDEPPVPVEFPQRGMVFGVNEMMRDREGNIWVASPINGLARVRHARVERVTLTDDGSEEAFIALMEDRSGTWWFANRRSGLLVRDEQGTRPFDFPSSRAAAALFEDNESRIWLASRDGSVFLKDNGTFVPQFVKSQVPSKVRSMTQDLTGAIWFGGTQGLATLTGDVVRQIPIENGGRVADVSIVRRFPGGKIIAGTTDGRLLLGDAQGFATVGTSDITNHRGISGILPVSANEVWISTLGGGLIHWNGRSWYTFGSEVGLPESRLTCIIDGGPDHLWLGSLSGIIRAERKGLLAHLQQREIPLRWLLLDHTDGLPSRECIGGFQPAAWKSSDGSLWFPTGGGIGRVRPDLVVLNEVAPPVFLQSVRANGVAHLQMNTPLTTGPGRARLEFRFVGLGLSAPEKTTYRVRLTGQDPSWHELGTQRFATFEAVPPGRYTFEVMAVNGDGVRSLHPASISVIVKPQLWETAWFFFLVASGLLLGAVGFGWFAARMRLKRRIAFLKIRNAREAERSRIARDLHDDLGASLTEISILSALAAEDAEETPIKPSLDHLSTKAKHLVSSLDEIVWAVNPREDTLRSLVDYLAAFSREYLESARIPLMVEIEGDIPSRPLAAPRRHGVFLATREVLNNIVKHSGATAVDMHFHIVPAEMEIRIHDNGSGFMQEYAGGGNGLGNLRTRMREAGGDCRIDSQSGDGTTVFLILPLPMSTKSSA